MKLLPPAVVCLLLSISSAGHAAHAFARFGHPRYAADFSHFEYVNPHAPKGGVLNLSHISQNSAFDTFNPFTLKGRAAPGLAELTFETLATYALDDLDTVYGLLAEDIDVAEDFGSTTFRLHAQARFSNGDPVTARDVEYSFATLTGPKASPRFKAYFADVADVTVVDPRTVRFEFKRKGRDLPFVVSSLPVFSTKWGLASNGAAPKTKLEFDQLGLTPPVASGPYVVSHSASGQNVIYTRNPSYWGWDIPVRRGSYNFDKVVYKLYRDKDGLVAAMRAGDFDFLSEPQMRYWCCQYIGHRFDSGEVLKLKLPHQNPRPMNGYIFNLRHERFQDIRVRRALNYAFDWEWVNAMIFDGEFHRQDSYFANTPLQATGTPSAAELALLEPFRSELDPAVFGPIVEQPSTHPPRGSYRENLRKAADLFAEAGWHRASDGVLRNQKGEAFTLRLNSSGLVEMFIRNLQKLGVIIELRANDPSIDRQNLRQFNYEFASLALREARFPGDELLRNFHSRDVDVKGSDAITGVDSKAVDFLIEKILDASNQAELETAAHAFDRVMLHHAYVLPWRYLDHHYLMFNKRLQRPDTLPLYYSPYEWALGQWWDGGV